MKGEQLPWPHGRNCNKCGGRDGKIDIGCSDCQNAIWENLRGHMAARVGRVEAVLTGVRQVLQDPPYDHLARLTRVDQLLKGIGA